MISAAIQEARDALPHGSIVALVTPFASNGSVDKSALRALIDFHIDNGTTGIAIAGTTGECSTLSNQEHRDLIVTAVEYGAGRVHIMAGVGANSTSEALELARFASAAGANSLLSVVPYYVKPTQEGLRRHFLAQADVSDAPLVVYNVPGRTVTDLSVETLARLAEHPNIRGIKDASGDMTRAVEIREALPNDFALYSGDDFTSMPYMTLGGRGVISVVANVAPDCVARLCHFIANGDIKDALRLFIALQPLTRALFVETSPGPAKFAVSLLGLCEPTIRLPLVIPEGATMQVIDKCVREAGKSARLSARRRTND
ncbi:4-hydroxy-tetrahydrodipicolinate synthase [Paraburkholderia caribensis]|uniref:4-hydroxy-tetrahydrodipicolinate synthase n=1 Tax=Paraburkholderia caribensis TaxID=75105 RepID=UPI001CB27B17|nr:4-hydroxy-tetrahydrodipicolinate synthase [Paraburkholderia caribensis]CAG9242133.1 4-hydroxy-tetrahydrodipicolinate synthase [Paraburkholderia caribensis]